MANRLHSKAILLRNEMPVQTMHVHHKVVRTDIIQQYFRWQQSRRIWVTFDRKLKLKSVNSIQNQENENKIWCHLLMIKKCNFPAESANIKLTNQNLDFISKAIKLKKEVFLLSAIDFYDFAFHFSAVFFFRFCFTIRFELTDLFNITNSDMLCKLGSSFSDCRDKHELTLRNI